MRKKLLVATLAVFLGGGVVFWTLSAPASIEAGALPDTTDAARGEQIFWAGGCASCHAKPGSDGAERLALGGGLELKTEFGTFVAPNISSDPEDGIGAWSDADFANAMLHGVSPRGEHYYPAFPYPSYARMTTQDVGDLFAFMKTLPAIEGTALGHQLSFPFTLRRGIGLWKQLYMQEEPVVTLATDASDPVKRGQYLVEGPGHCGECHTPRSFTGGQDYGQWLAGAVAAEGDGVVPNITPGEGGLDSWSASDIAYYLESGFTPDFDSVGGAMVSVQKNMAELSKDDRDAIAAYLKSVPARPNGYPASR
ncbi:c-type cytochrome [Nitratireductor pacificus]|uniref:Gluconate 2-dehydrogenase (Acceptor) n=1 Tax=Nitratireductor pacificus pht-3B TaxID=391937 RepID=K2LQ07_9HYPH|nr:c-type cytochrome [Nitratireductor pacificus]EKF19809.1 Gluconate 2-dehydrogenase (acceptor) [Nitratireductor pacificus pht-3B]